PVAADSVGVAMPKNIRPMTEKTTIPTGRIFQTRGNHREPSCLVDVRSDGEPLKNLLQTTITTTNVAARPTPGKIPAMNKGPIGTCAVAPHTTASALGGSIIASAPAPNIAPIDRLEEYPFDSIPG